jgi:hypothetical protein
VSARGDFGTLAPASSRVRQEAQGARLLLPLGWALAAAGTYGPWIAHATAALTLTGIDMAEFVKFIPVVQSGELPVVRQLFYLPPLAVVLGIALLVHVRRLGYPLALRLAALALAVPVSLQLLPPAWSPASLMTAEFRLQVVALGACWFALAGSWLLARLPAGLLAATSTLLALIAAGAATWQLLLVKPEIDRLYGSVPPVGWGFYACVLGLVVMTFAGVVLVVAGMRGRRG